MARGKWLSEDEKVAIARMRADGMAPTQIASQMQRGLKTIQRVLAGKYSSDAGAQPPLSPPGALDVSRDCVGRMAVGTLAAPPIDKVVEVSAAVPVVRNTQMVEAIVHSEHHAVVKMKPPTRPKKITTQSPASACVMTIKSQSTQPQLATVPSPSIRTLGGRVRSPTGIQHPARVNAMRGSSPTTSQPAISARHPEVAIDVPRSTQHVPQTQPPRQLVAPSVGVQTLHHVNCVDVPCVIPDDREPAERTHSFADEIESMANTISDDESDDDTYAVVQDTTHESPPRIVPQDANSRQFHPLLQAKRLTPSNMRITSPLRNFENQLHSSQALSWSSSTSQIEPEPVIAKKRKVAIPLEQETEGPDPIERALAGFEDALKGSPAAAKPDIHGQRLALLFHRFQADVRLVQLERQRDQATSTPTSFCF